MTPIPQVGKDIRLILTHNLDKCNTFGRISFEKCDNFVIIVNILCTAKNLSTVFEKKQRRVLFLRSFSTYFYSPQQHQKTYRSHNSHYVFFQKAILYNQPHMLHLFLVLRARRYNIKARSVDARMAEQIRQLSHILFNLIK